MNNPQKEPFWHRKGQRFSQRAGRRPMWLERRGEGRWQQMVPEGLVGVPVGLLSHNGDLWLFLYCYGQLLEDFSAGKYCDCSVLEIF